VHLARVGLCIRVVLPLYCNRDCVNHYGGRERESERGFSYLRRVLDRDTWVVLGEEGIEQGLFI
jgi:hypothetical protein